MNDSSAEVSLPNTKDVVSPRIIGRIIHESYGIGLDGSKMEGKGFVDLLKSGYEIKEINIALKSGLFLETMKDLATTLSPDTFHPSQTKWEGYAGEKEYSFNSPKDLINEYGRLDMGLVKLYLASFIGDKANETWRGHLKEAYPQAYETIRYLSQDADETDEQTTVLAGLDLGLDIILGTHSYIKKNYPDANVGESMALSLPMLYRIASQNMDTKGSPDTMLSVGLEFNGDTEKERDLRVKAKEELKLLSFDELLRLKREMLDSFFDLETYRKEPNSNHIQALEQMDILFNNSDAFLSYLVGVSQLPESVSADEQTRIYYDAETKLRTIDYIPEWLKSANIPVSPNLQDTLIELERTIRTYSLNNDYFEGTYMPDRNAVQVRMKTVDSPEPGRAKEKLFREEINTVNPTSNEVEFIPADQVVPDEKTVRCSAMHAILPSVGDNIKRAEDAVTFHPGQLNGIAFVVLLDLLATSQAA